MYLCLTEFQCLWLVNENRSFKLSLVDSSVHCTHHRKWTLKLHLSNTSNIARQALELCTFAGVQFCPACVCRLCACCVSSSKASYQVSSKRPKIQEKVILEQTSILNKFIHIIVEYGILGSLRTLQSHVAKYHIIKIVWLIL